MQKKKLEFLITWIALFAGGAARTATNYPVTYRCQLRGGNHNITGYLVVTPKDLADGGSSLDLSDTPGIGDTANEFSSASLLAFSASGGKELVSAVIAGHDPARNMNGMTAVRVAKAQKEVVLGVPYFELRSDNIILRCDLTIF